MHVLQSSVKLMAILLMLFGFLQCSSQKMVKNPPFTLGAVVAEDWISESDKASGTNVFVPITSGKAIRLGQLYFREKVVTLERIQRDSYLVYIGRFTHDNSANDMILHGDPRKEFGNKPPKIGKKIPFELRKDEAVVTFMKKGKVKYYKIKGIRTSMPIEIPKKNPQKED